MSKNKKINIFIVGDNYSQFKLLNQSFNIINISNVDVNSIDVDDNIYINTSKDTYNNINYKNNVIDFSREHDLKILNSIKQHNINTPNFIFCDVVDMAKHMKYSLEYVLKSKYGARSLGQMFVTINTLIDVIEFLRNEYVDYNMFNDRFNVDLSTCNNDIEKAYLFNSIKNNECYLTEKIQFESEYRVLYMGENNIDDIIIEKRSGYQIHSKEIRSHEVISIDDTCDPKLFKNILTELIKFGESHKSPCLSFDVYINKGSWGLFEYSNQFGIVYPDMYEYMRYKFSSAINNEIKKFNNKG